MEIWKKWKKLLGDIIILHRRTINDNHMIYGSWDNKGSRQKFLSSWNILCPFTPLTHNPKNQTLKKMKKTPGDIIILHSKCTINDNHMMYGFWDMKHDRQNFWLFWTVFCTFTLPLTNQKIKILKNWKKKKKKKKCLEISSLHSSLPKIMIICYTVPEIWRLGYFLLFYLPNSPKNQNKKNKKNEKKDLEITFYICVPKIMIICYAVPKIWCMIDVITFYFGLFFALLTP